MLIGKRYSLLERVSKDGVVFQINVKDIQPQTNYLNSISIDILLGGFNKLGSSVST